MTDMKKNKLKEQPQLTDDEMAKKIQGEIIAGIPISTEVDFDNGIQTSKFRDGRVITESVDNEKFKSEIRKNIQDS